MEVICGPGLSFSPLSTTLSHLHLCPGPSFFLFFVRYDNWAKPMPQYVPVGQNKKGPVPYVQAPNTSGALDAAAVGPVSFFLAALSVPSARLLTVVIYGLSCFSSAGRGQLVVCAEQCLCRLPSQGLWPAPSTLHASFVDSF